MTYSVGSCWLFRNEAEWSLLASGYDDVVRNNQNFNSASSLYHEKVSWLRLVTRLLNFSRLQRCESLYSLSPPWDHLLVGIKLGWKHYQKVDPLFGVLLLQFFTSNFQFSKSIKSSTFRVFLNLNYPFRKNISFPKCQKITQKFTQNRQTVVMVISIEI